MLLSACAGMNRFSGQDRVVLEQEVPRINASQQLADPAAEDTYNLMVAELALNRGETDIAVEYYLKLAKSQDNPDIAERAVRVAVYGQNMEAAIIAAQRWIELDPQRVEAHQIIAAIFIRQDRADEAFGYIDHLIQTSKLDDKQLFAPLLGVMAREKNSATVLSVSRRIAEKYPQRAYAQYMHGMLAAQYGKSEEALVYLDRSISLDQIDGVDSARARVLLKLGESQQAIVSLQKALEKNPDDRELRLTYARLLVDTKNYESARVEFETLLEASPDDAELLFTLGLLSLESEQYENAEKYMLKLVELDEREGEAQYYLGRIHENREQFDEAIDWYRQVHVGDFLLEARLRVASLLDQTGKLDEALDMLDAMLEGSQPNPTLVRIYITRGGLLREAGRYEDAMETYNTALGILPGNSDLLYARALVAEKVGRIDILEEDIKVILKAEPDNAHALNALGFTLADRTDRHNEAMGYLKRALEIMPDDAAIIDSMGWVNYRLGNYTEAIRLLRDALSRFDDAEIAAHLGEVLWVSGNRDEARQIWQEALDKSPSDPVLQKVMQRFIP